MFLEIDKFESKRIAAIDDSGESILYGELAECTTHIEKIIPSRSVVFLMCDNTIGCLTAYISMIENDIIPIMLNHSIDKALFITLFETYKPQYLCMPLSQTYKYDFKSVYEEKGFCYLKTKQEQYAVNSKLQLLMSTSGSTGSPKLVRYKKGNLKVNAKNVAKAWEWTNEERPICDLAMNYTMGLNVINTHLYVGATLLLMKSNVTEGKYWEFVKKHGATNLTGVPFSYDLLWKLRFTQMDIPTIQTLSVGGGKMSDEMFEKVAIYCCSNNKRFISSFGATETAARIAMLKPDKAIEKTGSIGTAIPEGNLMLFDNKGKKIEKIDSEGELVYEGPNVTMGYAYNSEDLMLGDIFNGIYHTGDIARRDNDGYYYIVGRQSRFVKLLGYRISLDQCEALINERFHVNCACDGNDEKIIIYMLPSHVNEKNVRHFISETTGIHISRFLVRFIDKIPRGTNGKILYDQL